MRPGQDGYGNAGKAWTGLFGFGASWCSTAGEAGLGGVRRGEVWCGKAGVVEHGEVRYGLVGHSKAGEALNGGMGCVMVQYGRCVMVRLVLARYGWFR